MRGGGATASSGFLHANRLQRTGRKAGRVPGREFTESGGGARDGPVGVHNSKEWGAYAIVRAKMGCNDLS